MTNMMIISMTYWIKTIYLMYQEKNLDQSKTNIISTHLKNWILVMISNNNNLVRKILIIQIMIRLSNHFRGWIYSQHDKNDITIKYSFDKKYSLRVDNSYYSILISDYG